MRLSHERCVHLSHLVVNLIEDDDQVEILEDPNDIRLKILQILEGEMLRQEELEEGIRKKIASGDPVPQVLRGRTQEGQEAARVARDRSARPSPRRLPRTARP